MGRIDLPDKWRDEDEPDFWTRLEEAAGVSLGVTPGPTRGGVGSGSRRSKAFGEQVLLPARRFTVTLKEGS